MSRRRVSFTVLLTVGLVVPLLAAPSATAASSSIDLNLGGHFQPGHGYSSTDVLLIEVYNEKDFFPTTGAIVDGLQGSCLFRATFEGDDLERHRLTCSTTEETGLWWLRDAGTAVSWIASSKSRVAPTNGELTCSTLYRLAHGSDVPEAVPGADCASRGAASSTMAAWSTAPVVDPDTNSSSWDEAAMYVSGSGGPVAVGLGSAGSEVMCGDAALWQSDVPSSVPGAPATHHRVWMPALGVVQLPQPPATNVETDNLVKPRCIDATTIGAARLNNTDRVTEYFVADISALRSPL